MMPAMPITPSASAMATASPVSGRSTSSSVTTRSPLRARRTVSAPPLSLAKSYTCIGWLSSNIT